MVFKGLMRSAALLCHSERDTHIDLLTAPVVHTAIPHLALAGHTAPDVAERVLEVPCRRPAATCMVIDAPRLSGAPARLTRERSRGHGRSSARRCRSAQGGQATPGALERPRPAGGPPRASRRGEVGDAGDAEHRRRGKMRGLECGRRGGDSGRAGEPGLSRGESLRSLSDLHLASESNYCRT
jgi:hypothetical protein